MFCPECKDEYREGFYTCADCGIDLVTELPEEPKQESAFVPRTRLFTVRNTAEAHTVSAFLQSHGIDAHPRADDCGGVDPALHFVHGTDIMVPVQDVDKCQELMKEYNSPYAG